MDRSFYLERAASGLRIPVGTQLGSGKTIPRPTGQFPQWHFRVRVLGHKLKPLLLRLRLRPSAIMSTRLPFIPTRKSTLATR
jgi:hypothetical protein